MKALDEQAVRDIFRIITKTLIDRKTTISTCESCTSGFLASLLTDTEGASQIFPGAYVTYSNREKIRLGVPEETVRTFSVYSKETAAAMAACCREAFGTDIGVGVTGTTGNTDPGNAACSHPGEVWFCINMRGKSYDCFLRLPAMEERFDYKIRIAGEIGAKLAELLFDKDLRE